MLLDALKKDDRLWIVSADADYLETLNKVGFLNPYLVAEVRERIGNIDNMFCFENLSDAVNHFLHKTRKEVDSSTDEALKEAAKADGALLL